MSSPRSHERDPADAAWRSSTRCGRDVASRTLDAGRDEARRALWRAGGTGPRLRGETLSVETDELLRVGLELSAELASRPARFAGPLPTIVAVTAVTGVACLRPIRMSMSSSFCLIRRSRPASRRWSSLRCSMCCGGSRSSRSGARRRAQSTSSRLQQWARADMTIRTTLLEGAASSPAEQGAVRDC